jgi:hypothetical protein
MSAHSKGQPDQLLTILLDNGFGAAYPLFMLEIDSTGQRIGCKPSRPSISQHSHVMRSIAFILSLVLALASLTGCTQPPTYQAWSSADSWYHPPSEWARFRQAQGLPDADIVEVAPDHMTAAEKQLRELSCVEIPTDRASELTGRLIPSRAGSLFLVRAVYLNRGTGKFMAVLVGSELLVEHGSLGHSAAPMRRQPLVVRLSQKPETVYVSCSMDE